MKQFRKLFIFFIFLLVVVSCGQSARQIKLEVSSNFIYTATSNGGMVIHAESAEGKKLTATAASGASINMLIPDGKWTFYVVAWEGINNNDVTNPTPAPTLLSGEVSCGKTTVDLGVSNTDVKLDISQARCNDASFGANATSSTGGFKDLDIYACSSLMYKTGNGEEKSFSTDTDQSELSKMCNSTINSYFNPEDEVEMPRSLKIIIPGNLTPGQSFPALSKCVSSSTVEKSSVSKFPLGKIPVIVEAYDKINCPNDGERQVYSFPNGLTVGNSNFDSLVNVGNKNALILAYTPTKRGRSPIFNLMPEFMCGSPANGSMRTFCSPSTFAVYQDLNFDYLIDSKNSRIVIDRNSNFSCNDLKNFNGNGHINQIGCEEHGEKSGGRSLVLNLETVSNATSCPNSPLCPISYELGNINFTKLIYVTPPNNTFLRVHQNFYEAVGGKPDLIWANSFDTFLGRQIHYGKLDLARFFIGHNAFMPLFSPPINITNVACEELSGERILAIAEGGKMKSYKAIIKNSSLAIPTPFTSGLEGPDYNYHKQVIFRELKEMTWQTQVVMHFRCDAPVGRIENQEEHNDDYVNSEKTILLWNTKDDSTARIESYSSRLEKDSTNKNMKMHREIDLTHKLNENDVTVESIKQERYIDNNGVFENLSRESLLKSSSTQGHISSIAASLNYSIPANEFKYDDFGVKPLPMLSPLPVHSLIKNIPLMVNAYVEPYNNTTPHIFAGIRNVSYDEKIVAGSPNVIYRAIVWKDGKSPDTIKVAYSKDNQWLFKTVATTEIYGFMPKVSINSSGNFSVAWYNLDTKYITIKNYTPTLDAIGESIDEIYIVPDVNAIALLKRDDNKSMIVYTHKESIIPNAPTNYPLLPKISYRIEGIEGSVPTSFSASDFIGADSLRTIQLAGSSKQAFAWAYQNNTGSFINFRLFDPDNNNWGNLNSYCAGTCSVSGTGTNTNTVPQDLSFTNYGNTTYLSFLSGNPFSTNILKWDPSEGLTKHLLGKMIYPSLSNECVSTTQLPHVNTPPPDCGNLDRTGSTIFSLGRDSNIQNGLFESNFESSLFSNSFKGIE